ncbi:MAG: CsbD family protein [Pseudomonadota bacterium]
MNKNQIKGKAKDIGGKIREEAGKIVGSNKQQVKGLNEQAEGKAQEKLGDVEESLKNRGKNR